MLLFLHYLQIAILCLVSGVLAEDPYVGANLGQGGYRGPGLGGAGPYGETNYVSMIFLTVLEHVLSFYTLLYLVKNLFHGDVSPKIAVYWRMFFFW